MSKETPAEKTGASFEQLLAGDVASLARAISILEAGGENSDALATRLRPYSGNAKVLAFTGPSGAGKSTLISSYVAALRQQGERVAVLAVDPSSPLSGGAVLGDRTRMGLHTGDQGVFIRSLAARGHLGGLSLAIPAVLDAVDAADWPIVILETVGAGQSETEVAEFADIKVVLNAPGLGDDVQAIKAGILEIADLLVVNKSDLPLADRTVRQLQAMLELRPAERREVPIVSTSATNQTGLDDLEQAIHVLFQKAELTPPEVRRDRRLRGLLRRRSEALFREYLDTVSTTDMDAICGQIGRGELSIWQAAESLAALTLDANDPQSVS